MRVRPWSPPAPPDDPAVALVTARWASVLDGMADGLTNREIARQMGVNEETVKTHAHQLFRAMGARDRAHAVALAVTGRVRVLVRVGAWEVEE
jgi:DNA-binding NarL/FixJ family response regulator